MKKILITLLFVILTVTAMTMLIPGLSAATHVVINLNDSGTGSLRQAIANATGGDTITFAANLNGTINLDSELSFDKNLTIDGEGKITLDGGGSVRVINYTGTGTLTLNGLTIQNGNIDGGGGGVYSNGTVDATNCTFTGNTAYYDGGGVLVVQFNTRLTLTDCTFTGNSAIHGGGGAAAYDGSVVELTGCTFTGNEAYVGGGIFANANYPIDGGSVKAINSIFTNNTATEPDSGAIETWLNVPVTLSHCTVVNNTGYGAKAKDSTLTVSNSILTGNNGGGDQTNKAITGDNLTGSYADIFGTNKVNLNTGWICPLDIPANKTTAVTTYTNDLTGKTRGTEYTYGALEPWLNTDLVVKNNNDSGPDSLRDIIGRLNNTSGNENVNVITFLANVTTIKLESNLPEIGEWVSETEIRGNPGVTIDGNKQYSIIRYAPDLDLTLSNLTIQNGKSGGYGGGGVAAGGNVIAADCKFIGNISGEFGGGVFAEGDSTLTDCTFTGNMAPGGVSGGLYAIGDSTLTDCTFTGNEAKYSGGLYVIGELTAINSMFTQNTTINSTSGAIDGDNNIILYHSTVADNTGMGVYSEFGEITAYNSIIAGNTIQTNKAADYDYTGKNLIDGIGGVTRFSIFGLSEMNPMDSKGWISPLDTSVNTSAVPLTDPAIVALLVAKDIAEDLRGTEFCTYGALEATVKSQISITGTNKIADTIGFVGDQVVTAKLTGAFVNADHPLELTAEIDGITVKATATANGEINFTFNGKDLNKLAVNVYDIKVSTVGNDLNKECEAIVGTLTVLDRVDLTITGTNNITQTVGTSYDLTIKANLSGGDFRSGNLMFTAEINGIKTPLPVTVTANGEMQFRFAEAYLGGLAIGDYPIKVSTPGNALNKECEAKVGTLTITDKSGLSITGTNNITKTIGVVGDQTITVTLSGGDFSSSNLTLTADINGIKIPLTVTANGEYKFMFEADKLNALAVGTYEIKVSTAGNSLNAKCEAVVGILTITDKAGLTIAGDNKITAKYGAVGEQVITAELSSGDYSGGALTFTADINGIKVTVTAIEDGELKFNFAGIDLNALAVGNYEIKVSTAGNVLNAKCEVKVGTLTIIKTTGAITGADDITKTYGDADFGVNLSAPGNPTFTLTSGNENVAVIIDGKIHIVGAGTVTIIVTASEVPGYEPMTDSFVLTVNKAVMNTDQLIKQLCVKYQSGLKLSDIKLPSGYAWVNPDTIIGVNDSGKKHPVIYTDPSGNYESAEIMIEVKVTDIPAAEEKPVDIMLTDFPYQSLINQKVTIHEVKFESNGGSKVTVQGIEHSGTISEPEAPTKEGYVFKGWYADELFRVKYDFAKRVTGSIVLHAKWELLK